MVKQMELSFICHICNIVQENDLSMGRGCGTGGRAVASNTTDPQFEFSHWQILITIKLLQRPK